VIQAIPKGIEIEMELQQEAHEEWRCDYTLITHPERTTTFHRGGLRLAVEGHTDNVGGDEYNQQLSEQRGGSVRNYLVEQGMSGGSVTSSGFGKTQPVASNETASGRQQNRRVELVISGEVIGQEVGAPAAQ
jgi:hypothetical protein